MPIFFVQNTKNVGSFNRFRDDENWGGKKKIDDSAPNYTPAAGINGNQNTF